LVFAGQIEIMLARQLQLAGQPKFRSTQRKASNERYVFKRSREVRDNGEG